MIYRGPSFLAVLWLGSSPIPFLPHSLSKLSLFLSLPVSPAWLLMEERGRGWARSQIIRLRESLALYNSLNTLWYWLRPNRVKKTHRIFRFNHLTFRSLFCRRVFLLCSSRNLLKKKANIYILKLTLLLFYIYKIPYIKF